MMTNGRPLDAEDYLLRSGVRSGLKREFAFALKSQTDLPNCLGRTRSGWAAPSGTYSLGGKKQRVSHRDAVVAATPLAETPVDEHGVPSRGVAMDVSVADTVNRARVDASNSGDNKEGSEKGESPLDGPILVVSNGKFDEKVPGGKLIKIYRRSVSKVIGVSTSSPLAPSTAPRAVETDAVLDIGKDVACSSEQEDEQVAKHQLLFCDNGSSADKAPTEQRCVLALEACGSPIVDNGAAKKPYSVVLALEVCNSSNIDKALTEQPRSTVVEGRNSSKVHKVSTGNLRSTVVDGCDSSSVHKVPEEKPRSDVVEGHNSSKVHKVPEVQPGSKVVEDHNSCKVHKVPTKKPRSKMIEDHKSSKVHKVPTEKPRSKVLEAQNSCKSVTVEKPIRRFTRSALKVMEVVAPISVEQQKNVVDTTPVVATLTLERKLDLVEIPVVVDDGGLGFEDGELNKSLNTKFKGSVKVEVISKGYLAYDIIDNAIISPLEKPTRKFTRSLHESAIEESTAVDASATTSCDSLGLDELKGDTEALNGILGMSSKKKLELKMSKKITLTKLPANVRDLLGTGLLEGLPVKYISCPGKIVGLQGVIRGNGILCSCALCQGTKVVSAYQFEIHAGSTKKHPSDFIFLQNGKSLREVLRSCNGSSLEMLESVIQNAVDPVPPKKLRFCQKCKGYFDSVRAGDFAVLCDSCLKPSHTVVSTTSLKASAKSSKLPKKPSLPVTSDATPKNLSSQNRSSHGKLTRKDLGLHKLVFMDDILPQGTEVGYYIRGKRLLEGYIKDFGIFCRCCNGVISPSQFEAHAGQATRRKPYNHIYTSNGVSLHELSVSLSRGRKLSPTENDDLCGVCADGGKLLLCDICPRAFHKECVGLSSIPVGDWFCQYCQNMRQKEKHLAHNDNAIAAGRVAGVDPIEQIIKRCIRIVTAPESDVSVCALCSEHDFSRSGFDRRTVIICDQCETEYHVGCLKDHDMADLKELPDGKWFCRPACSRIHFALHELLCQGPEALEESDANIRKIKLGEKGLCKDAVVDIKWKLLSGKDDSVDSKLLLSQAVSIFRECFDPIVEPISGRDLIPFMVYGRNMRDQDFGGMYCMVLTLNSLVISAVLLRVLGCEVAELPLVATKRDCQGLGYFQSLFSCIERLFKSLEVKHFILPAAEEAESIWTNKFGFAKLTPVQFREYAKDVRPMFFHGTSTLHKLVPGVEPAD